MLSLGLLNLTCRESSVPWHTRLSSRDPMTNNRLKSSLMDLALKKNDINLNTPEKFG
jgi:hypothetical protein